MATQSPTIRRSIGLLCVAAAVAPATSVAAPFKVSNSLPTQVVFEAGVFGNTVAVGRGGNATTERVDADLVVYDPFFTTDAREEAFFFNASTSDLTLGTGNSTTSGDDGDIFLQDGSGNTSVSISGSGGSITLGESTGNDGELFLRDSAGSTAGLSLDGGTGNISTNQLNGNGLVKAWARVGSDGVVDSCYRCNSSATESQKIAGFTGAYEIDFTPLGTDISDRPWTCSLGTGETFSESGRSIYCVQRSADASSVFVQIQNAAGADTDSAYTIVVY